MKNIWALLICTVIFPVLVTGCSEIDNKALSDSKNENKVTIKFHSHGNEKSYNWKNTIDAFEKKYPNIDVELVILSEKGDTQEATKKLDLAAASGEQMDVIMFSESASYSQRVSMGMVAPLDEFIKKEGYKVSEEYKVDTEINGKYYALPGKFNPWYVLLNKDHLDAAGLKIPKDWTWDEFMEYAKAMTRDGHYGTYFHGPQNGSWMEYLRLALASEAEKTEFTTDDGNSNLNHSLFKKTLEIRVKMEKADQSAVPYADILTNKLNYREQFFNQAASSIIIGSWMNSELGGTEINPLNFNITVAPFPKNDKADIGGYTPVTTDYMAIAAKSEHKKEAYTFIRWYTTEGQIIQGKNVPSWNKVSDRELTKIIDKILGGTKNPERIDEDSLIHVLTNSKSSKIISPVPNQAEIYKVLNEEYEKLIFGEQNIDRTIEVSQERVQEILNNNK
ncbi:multiple sugar transport system substrate-binding protein [Neobacillus niacini]|uniref:ABC transporter substrate-binding protein n=1 Tax=Neobacillus niacini TaxID=86668 RepID=UPI002781BE83|nr:extracellular solute-binding protein [Neobacillus niacini]MDQ1004507.1 multiple sugar transport system substrate-binding protein [Neobacillus niacini]